LITGRLVGWLAGWRSSIYKTTHPLAQEYTRSRAAAAKQPTLAASSLLFRLTHARVIQQRKSAAAGYTSHIYSKRMREGKSDKGEEVLCITLPLVCMLRPQVHIKSSMRALTLCARATDSSVSLLFLFLRRAEFLIPRAPTGSLERFWRFARVGRAAKQRGANGP